MDQSKNQRHISFCMEHIFSAPVFHDLLEGHVPDWAELDQFAGVVSGVDYYLERIAGPSAAGADEILELAQRGMTELTSRAPQMPAAAAFVEPEPVAVDTAEQQVEAVEPAPADVAESALVEPASPAS